MVEAIQPKVADIDSHYWLLSPESFSAACSMGISRERRDQRRLGASGTAGGGRPKRHGRRQGDAAGGVEKRAARPTARRHERRSQRPGDTSGTASGRETRVSWLAPGEASYAEVQGRVNRVDGVGEALAARPGAVFVHGLIMLSIRWPKRHMTSGPQQPSHISSLQSNKKLAIPNHIKSSQPNRKIGYP
jgi:hypothetical protein